MWRRRRRRTRFDDSQARQCAWCGQALPPRDVFGFGAKARPGVDLGPYRGQVVEIDLSRVSRRAPALVVATDSPAARAGHDLYFVACSHACLVALKTALVEEIDPGGAAGPGPEASR
jgi:hypothetical protein